MSKRLLHKYLVHIYKWRLHICEVSEVHLKYCPGDSSIQKLNASDYNSAKQATGTPDLKEIGAYISVYSSQYPNSGFE